MKLKPKDFLDFSVVIIGLLLSSLIIAGLDEFETRTTANRTVSIAPWHGEPPPRGSLERDYLVIRNSVRRWMFFYFPALSLLGGAAVGIACSGWRRAWFLAVLATAAVPVTAAGLLLLYPGTAAIGAAAYVGMAGVAGTASGWFLERHHTRGQD
jgi:hypothetical protein